MPELPEVETTVRDLKKAHPPIIGSFFVDVVAESPKIIKKPSSFSKFKEEIKNKKIINIWRRGKNIIFELSENRFLLIHQKLTGHLLYGQWEKEKGKWVPKIKKEPFFDPHNLYLRVIFTLNNGWQLALSDLRKFAKIELLDEKALNEELKELGPEPLEKDFTLDKFLRIFQGKKGKIKTLLMDQKVIAGIGNIYSDEILWRVKIHPLQEVKRIPLSKLEEIYLTMRSLLKEAISLGGESISDYRRPNGEKGKVDLIRKVYQREGEPCERCKTKIQRVKIGERSTHFCPKCQRL